jgi:hypothetical protein
MSIKTSKRIALGVIASLVFAPFAAIAPASAAVTAVSVAGGPFTVVAGTSLTFTADGAASTTEIGVGITGPDDSVYYAADTQTSTGWDSRVTVGAVTSTDASVTIDGTLLTTPGVYKISTAGETTVDALDTVAELTAAGVLIERSHIVVVPAPSSTLVATQSNNAAGTINLTGTDTPVLTAARPVGNQVSSGALRIRVEASANTAMYPVGAVAATGGAVGAGTATITHGTDATAGRSFLLANNLTAGSYTFKMFVDANANGLFDSSELNADITTVISGPAVNSSVSLDRSSILNATTTLTATVSLTDAGGRPSYGNVTLTPSSTTTGAALLVTMQGSAAGAPGIVSGNGTRIGKTNQYRITAAYAVGAAGPGATIVLTSSLTTGAARTASFTVADSLGATATELSLESKTGIFFGAAGTASYTTVIPSAVAGNLTRAVTVDPAVTSLSFTLTGTAGKVYAVTATPGANTPSSRISAPTSVTTLADQKVTFTVTVTTPTVTTTTADSFTITVTDTAGPTAFAYTITYANPVALWTLTPATAPDVLEKSTNKITARLTDSFGRVLANTAYTVQVTGRNVSAATGVTNASGIAEYTVTDTATTSYATVGGLPRDTVTFTNVGTVALPGVSGAVTLNYKATLAAVGTVTVTVAAANKVIDQAEVLPGSPAAGAIATFTATVRTTAGASVGAGTLVTFAGGTDDLFVDGVNSGVTNASGQVAVSVYRQKVGFANITATANTVSGAASSILWVNGGQNTAIAAVAFGDHRNVKLSATQTVAPGSAATVVATVHDRWGNPVSGITVTFSLTGAGRVVTGETTTKRTDINGNAQVQVTSLATEAGVNTVTATISGGQTADLAGFVGGATVDAATGFSTAQGARVAVAGVTAGNRTASSTVTFATPPAPVTPEVVIPPVAPTLTGSLERGRVLLFGACEPGEGDLIIYVKSPGKAWQERAKTLECAVGEFDGSLRAPKNTKYYRVKQEGTGLWSGSVLIRR